MTGTLRRSRRTFLAYGTTGRVNYGGIGGANCLVETLRPDVQGSRNRRNYWLRMLPVGIGLDSRIPASRPKCHQRKNIVISFSYRCGIFFYWTLLAF